MIKTLHLYYVLVYITLSFASLPLLAELSAEGIAVKSYSLERGDDVITNMKMKLFNVEWENKSS